LHLAHSTPRAIMTEVSSSPPAGSATWHLVFVYGTLKRGFTNYNRYLKPAETHAKAICLGKGMTVYSFPMVIRPKSLPPCTFAPCLMDRRGTGDRIEGEVWEVDTDVLKGLDILEGIAKSYYYRAPTDVELEESTGSTSILSCQTYFFPASDMLLAEPLLACYGPEQHSFYDPFPPNPEITALCSKARPHGLETTQTASMEVHCLRLLPGQDVLEELLNFCGRHSISAAIILTCVGSTGQTTLRPAGVPSPKIFQGKFEIVSLTGTLGCSGHHLHMSISDEECRTFGGHVLKGCLVRTTAEIALGVLPQLRFTRPVDERTGYDELCIGRRFLEDRTNAEAGLGDSPKPKRHCPAQK